MQGFISFPSVIRVRYMARKTAVEPKLASTAIEVKPFIVKVGFSPLKLASSFMSYGLENNS